MSAGMPMPTGILRFFNFAFTPRARIDCKPSFVLSCEKLRILRLLEVLLHVFYYLSMANCNNCETRNVASNRFFTLLDIRTSHKYPLMGLHESDNLQHCKNVHSPKNYMKMVKLGNAVDASKKPLHFLGAQNLTKTMLNQHSFQKNSPNFPRISYRVFWAFLASEGMTGGASGGFFQQLHNQDQTSKC